MAGREYSSYQQGVIKRFYEHKDTIALQRLGEVVSDLYLAQGKKAEKLWDTARGSLMKIAAGDPRTIDVLRERSVEKLAKLVNDLDAEAAASAKKSQHEDSSVLEAVDADVQPAPPSQGHTAAGTAEPVLTPERLKSAMKAFRKRLKLTQLDDESRLARSPMSSGKSSQIKAILPPREFPSEVWEALVKEGKLRRAGGGFYELAE